MTEQDEIKESQSNSSPGHENELDWDLVLEVLQEAKDELSEIKMILFRVNRHIDMVEDHLQELDKKADSLGYYEDFEQTKALINRIETESEVVNSAFNVIEDNRKNRIRNYFKKSKKNK